MYEYHDVKKEFRYLKRNNKQNPVVVIALIVSLAVVLMVLVTG